MAKITSEELSDSLKEYLNGLGLTEAQVQELINKFEDEKIGDISQLNTEDKTIIGAINELFQNANNGKELIANAIGSPLINADSTFSAMSEAISEIRRNNEYVTREVLFNMMEEDGYNEANSEMSVDELIDLLNRSSIEIGDIKQIACGGDHTFVIKTDGSLWACGYNNYGQLGLNDTDSRNTFTKVTTNINNDVKQVACSRLHTIILKNDGSVWSCGYNAYGNLGLNDTTHRNTFTQVTTNINDVKQIVCGDGYTIILKNDGSLWACGYNVDGNLGLGDTTNRNTFTQVTTNINNDVKQVDCGHYHTFIIKNDGSLWCCGDNQYGRLGLGDTTDRNIFTQVTTNINNDVKQIACGMNYTFILKNDGSAWSCGRNAYGGLGLNDITNYSTFTKVTTNVNNDVRQIACGSYHTIIIKNDGSVWTCGRNGDGQLGLDTSDENDHTTFTKVTTNINNDVKQIYCGSLHTYILKSDGSIWSCGRNNYGQLGLGDTTNRSTFTNTNFTTPIPEYDIDKKALYNYLLSNDISVTESMDIGTMLNLLVDDYINNKILEYESNLRIILTDEGVSVTDEDNMASLITKVDNEFSNDNNTISELEDDIENTRNTLAGLMQEGGYNINGDEDINSLLDLLVISGISVSDIKQIDCGHLYTIILKNNGSLWACGRNDNGQLGLGDVADKNTFTKVTNGVKQIASGDNYTFIIKNDGSLWCCGNNEYGQLGLGDVTYRPTFTQVTTNINKDVKQIACGYDHTLILKNDGSVWACGLNNVGQLGLGHTTSNKTFTQVTTNINNDVKRIACGEYHTFILKNDGSVWACGMNTSGQLGLGDTTNRTTFTQVTTNINNDIKQIDCVIRRTFILKNDGSLWACGRNNLGQLGLGDTTHRTTFTQVTTNINNDVKQISGCYFHTFILKNDGSIWGCGNNANGQLGLGTNNNTHSTFTKVTTSINNDVKQIAGGYEYTLIIKNDGSVWGCGYNYYGQLGLGNNTDKTTFTMIPRGF